MVNLIQFGHAALRTIRVKRSPFENELSQIGILLVLSVFLEGLGFKISYVQYLFAK